MLLLRKPTDEFISRFLAAQAKLSFTYAAVGSTAAAPPAGYLVDRTRIRLGQGEAVFARAKQALKEWKQFDLGWLKATPANTPIEADEVVAILARATGMWWLNACRIIYVIDETGPVPRFGFAYGTLPDHAGTGEERFLIEWDHVDDSVWYDILAFSRLKQWLARMGYPLARRTQKRFGRESAAAMLRALKDG